MPKLLRCVASLLPELAEHFAIRINGAASLLGSAPFWEALGCDEVANGLLANPKLPSYPRNRSPLLMQRSDLLIEGEAPEARSLSTRQFAAGSFLPEPFRRLCMLVDARMMEKAFHHFPKIF